MKKLLITIIAIIMFLTVGCRTNDEEKYKVLLPSGTPLIAVGDLLTNDKFEFEIVNGQDPLSAAFVQGGYDLIIAPLNLGAKLYLAGNSTYKLEAVITTNNTYIMSKTEISSINDLDGKKVVTYGQGSSPWIALKTALDINNITSELISQSSASDVASLFAANTSDGDYFLGAEPNITILKTKQNLTVHTLDVSEVIKEDLPVLVQACLFVNPNSNVPENVLKLIEDNIKNMNSNPKEYAQSIVSKNQYFETLGKEVIEEAIPKCNITYLKAKDNVNVLTSYYNLLNKYVAAVLGGQTPNEQFYN